MKLKLLLGLLLVVGMIGIGLAAEENEEQSDGTIEDKNYRKALTPDEVMAIFGNLSWEMPEEMRQNMKKHSREKQAREKNKTPVIKKPLTPEQIAEINANAPEGMFLISGIIDNSMTIVPSENTQIEEGKIVMDWSVSDDVLSSNLIRNSATVSVPNVAILDDTCTWKWIQNESTANPITIMYPMKNALFPFNLC